MGSAGGGRGGQGVPVQDESPDDRVIEGLRADGTGGDPVLAPPLGDPLVLVAFGIGALGGTTAGGRLGDRRPMATTLTAAAATALVLLLLIPLSAHPVTATALVFLMGLTGVTANPVATALAVRLAGEAPSSRRR